MSFYLEWCFSYGLKGYLGNENPFEACFGSYYRLLRGKTFGLGGRSVEFLKIIARHLLYWKWPHFISYIIEI